MAWQLAKREEGTKRIYILDRGGAQNLNLNVAKDVPKGF
jgi:hypothetical protein